jgi:hypothetical protein
VPGLQEEGKGDLAWGCIFLRAGVWTAFVRSHHSSHGCLLYTSVHLLFSIMLQMPFFQEPNEPLA